MDIQNILNDLKRERARLDRAIAALEEGGAEPRRRGRPVGSGSGKSRPRRHMSPAARKRISEMMKQRWAERKRKSKS
jgi:hypothetical protein